MQGSAMNGASSPIPQIALTNPVIELLTNMLNEAKAGRISSAMVVGVTPQSGMAMAYAGGQRSEIYLGCGLAQTRLLADIEAPQQNPSRIIRAGMVG